METMDDFKEELEASFRGVTEGEIMTGTVIGITDTEVILDLKFYTEGVIRAADYSSDPAFSIKTDVQKGDRVSATVISKDDGQGHILLSRVEATKKLAWAELQDLKDSKTPVDVHIREVVPAGAIAYLCGIRGFIPASKLDVNYVEDTSVFVGKNLKVLVFELNQKEEKLILSAKELLKEEEDKKRRETISNLQVGFVTQGTVESLMPYGAFVTLGNGLSGLVHISEISPVRIKHPSDVLSEGDHVKVKVIAIKDGKLSLSIRAVKEDAQVKEVEEEVVEIPKAEEIGSNLGDLLKKLNL